MPWCFGEIIYNINNDNNKWCDYLNMWINDIDEEFENYCPNQMQCSECEYNQTVLNK
jgi:hypothetical protein